MVNMMANIREFHKKNKLVYKGKPKFLDLDLHNFRVNFMQEELNEYIEARAETNLEGQLDALVDLVYVALGTAYMHGFDFEEAWKRVHKANLKKVRAMVTTDSKRGSEYDVVKPEGWVPPYLKDLI